jgi:hypothetical protein
MSEDEPKTVQFVRVKSEWTLEALKEHLEAQIKANADLQDSKWIAQTATNVASNEWRDTIGDLKRDFVPRSEHNTLEARFAADQLATARTLSNTGGEKSGAREAKQMSIAVISAVILAAGTLGGLVASWLKGAPVVQQAQQPQVYYVPAQPGTLIPSTPQSQPQTR